jgi:DNA gyrase/topoisomerase IV subunit A
LRGILESPEKVRGIIRSRHGSHQEGIRRPTPHANHPARGAELKPEDLIAEEDVVVTITRDGYKKAAQRHL